MSKRIKNFNLDGEFIDDSHAILARVRAENMIDHIMRDKGYVKVLDIDTFWEVYYDGPQDKWFYSISAYGVYIGKRKARENAGWSQGKLIPRSTHQIMSR